MGFLTGKRRTVQRKCSHCGHTWIMTEGQAKLRPSMLIALEMGAAGAVVNNQVSNLMTCVKCGSTIFTDRVV